MKTLLKIKKKLESVAEPSVRADLNVIPLSCGRWVGQNYGPIFRPLWTKVHQITIADAGEIIVCNAVFRLSISCSVPEIFAIEVRSRPKSRRKNMFSVIRPHFFLGGGGGGSPNFGPSF